MPARTPLSRRSLLTAALAALGLGLEGLWPENRAEAQSRRALGLATVSMAEAPEALERFTKTSGWPVKSFTVSDHAETLRNLLLAEVETGRLDVLHATGGLVNPLVNNNLVEPIDTTRLRNWQGNAYIQTYFAPGTPGFGFIGRDEKVYGVPTILQGDSFAFLPEVTGSLNSYGALFDPQWRGRVAIEDSLTTAGHKTALYLKQSGLAEIADPADPTEREISLIVDFLVEQKRAGQFRTLWTSREEAVKLLTEREVVVLEGPEPVAAAAREAGVNAVYAAPTEGQLLWAATASILRNPERSQTELEGVYTLVDFFLGGFYGTWIGLKRGFMTNTGALTYVNEHGDDFTPDEAVRVQALDSGGRFKFEKGGIWRNRWPSNRHLYEQEWQRLREA